MELKWIEDFVMLASTGSFSRAADARNITQSAFSRRIKNLEVWLGAPLISRATIPAELTAEGRAFLPVAQEAIRSFYATRDSLRPARKRRAPQLNFAALHTLTVTAFPGWLENLETEVTGVQATVIPDRGGIEANLEALISGDADLFLTYSHPYVPVLLDPEQFDWKTLGHEAILPVIAPRLRYADQAAPASFANYLEHMSQEGAAIPYLDYGPVSFFGTALQRLFSNKRLTRAVAHESSISVGLRQLALGGWGLCWLPESLVREDLDSGALILASPNPDWQLEVEIRLYRCKNENSGLSEDLWQKVASAFSLERSDFRQEIAS